MLTVPDGQSAKDVFGLFCVNHDVSAPDELVGAIVSDYVLYFVFLLPCLYAEGLWYIVSGPEHEATVPLYERRTGVRINCVRY